MNAKQKQEKRKLAQRARIAAEIKRAAFQGLYDSALAENDAATKANNILRNAQKVLADPARKSLHHEAKMKIEDAHRALDTIYRADPKLARARKSLLESKLEEVNALKVERDLR